MATVDNSRFLSQISFLQDTPELLGFLRNTSASSRRHKRSTSDGYSGKTLVSLTHMNIPSRNQMFIRNSQVFILSLLFSASFFYPTELHQYLLSEDFMHRWPIRSRSERRGEDPLQTLGAHFPAGQCLNNKIFLGCFAF